MVVYNVVWIATMGKRRFKMQQNCNGELLDKCERGNKIGHLQHKCRANQHTPAEVEQFHYPSQAFFLDFYMASELHSLRALEIDSL